MKKKFFALLCMGCMIFFSAQGFAKTPAKKKKPSAAEKKLELSAEEEKLDQKEKIVLWAQKIKEAKKKQVTVKGRNLLLDCSNFVRAVYLGATGVDLFDDAVKKGIFDKLSKAWGFNGARGALVLYVLFRVSYQIRQVPEKGDIIFFDNTYDKNRNRKWDDPLTHVGIVINVDEEGTVTFIHGGTSRGVIQDVLNVRLPAQEKMEDKKINSHIQKRYAWQKKRSRLAGELARAFGGF